MSKFQDVKASSNLIGQLNNEVFIFERKFKKENLAWNHKHSAKTCFTSIRHLMTLIIQINSLTKISLFDLRETLDWTAATQRIHHTVNLIFKLHKWSKLKYLNTYWVHTQFHKSALIKARSLFNNHVIYYEHCIFLSSALDKPWRQEQCHCSWCPGACWEVCSMVERTAMWGLTDGLSCSQTPELDSPHHDPLWHLTPEWARLEHGCWPQHITDRLSWWLPWHPLLLPLPQHLLHQLSPHWSRQATTITKNNFKDDLSVPSPS